MRTRSAATLLCPLLACFALLVPAPASAQDVGTRIVGGNDAEPGDYPWQVALEVRQSTAFAFQMICGGTLISANQVVTAAHCTSGKASNMRVRVGSQALESGGTTIGVASWADHPDYSSSTDKNDAAVLQLSASATAAGGEPLQLIGQEGSADDALWAAGEQLMISGWGDTSEGGDVSEDLQEAAVPRVADSTCGQSDWYGNLFDSATMVCAGLEQGGVDTCQGDSGGPMVATTQSSPPSNQGDPSQWRLVGITSWGFGCAREKKPGVYTRVAAPAIRNWILGAPPPAQFALNVTVTGSGSVTSSPTGINCPGDCTQSYTDGTDVTLTADPDPGSTFVSWSGACTGSTTQCTVDMTQARSVTATFNTPPAQFALSVTVNGAGTVTSSPVGIDCPGDCSQSYDDGTDVTLTADPETGSTFANWGGACSGTSTQCVVDMTQARSVTATFNTPPGQFALNVTVNGSGSVTSNPLGIDCPGDCTQSYDDGTDVTLDADPDPGSTFVSWSGACAGSSTQCVVDMTQARSVTATFNTPPAQFALNVTVNGDGAVTSDPIGIDCPGDCSQSYDDGTDVTLMADPDPGSTFAGWGGACSGTATECTVDMTQARSVTATFNTAPAPPPPTTHTLTVAKSGTGAGTVTSSPSGISCGSDCSQGYTVGTDVTLTASAASGSTFSGWTGACSGTSPCVVSMDGARSVTATFTVQQSPDPEPEPEPEPDPDRDPQPSPDPEPDETAPVAEIATKPLVMSRRGVVRLGVDCGDSPEDCLGNARLRMRFPADASAAALRTVARASFEIAAGETKRVKMRLKRRARRVVKREGKVRVRVIVVVEDAAGNTRTIRKRLTLRAAE